MRLETVNETRQLLRGRLLSIENRLRNWEDTAPHGLRLTYFVEGFGGCIFREVLPGDFFRAIPTGRDALDFAEYCCPSLGTWSRFLRLRDPRADAIDYGISCRIEKLPAPDPEPAPAPAPAARAPGDPQFWGIDHDGVPY